MRALLLYERDAVCPLKHILFGTHAQDEERMLRGAGDAGGDFDIKQRLQLQTKPAVH